MILQRDGRMEIMNPWIKKNGCYLMCLLFYINKFTNTELSPESMAGPMFRLFVRNGWMSDAAWIKDPEAILGWGGVQCEYADKHEPPTRVCGEGEFEILYFRHPEVGGHFVCGDGNGNVTYDPWGVSRAATEGTLVSKRVFAKS